MLREERERYETVRLELMVTPGHGDEALDPLLNNPLSQHEQVGPTCPFTVAHSPVL